MCLVLIMWFKAATKYHKYNKIVFILCVICSRIPLRQNTFVNIKIKLCILYLNKNSKLHTCGHIFSSLLSSSRHAPPKCRARDGKYMLSGRAKMCVEHSHPTSGLESDEHCCAVSNRFWVRAEWQHYVSNTLLHSLYVHSGQSTAHVCEAMHANNVNVRVDRVWMSYAVCTDGNRRQIRSMQCKSLRLYPNTDIHTPTRIVHMYARWIIAFPMYTLSCSPNTIDTRWAPYVSKVQAYVSKVKIKLSDHQEIHSTPKAAGAICSECLPACSQPDSWLLSDDGDHTTHWLPHVFGPALFIACRMQEYCLILRSGYLSGWNLFWRQQEILLIGRGKCLTRQCFWYVKSGAFFDGRMFAMRFCL